METQERTPGRLVAHVKQWLSILSLSRLIRWSLYVFLCYWVWTNWHEDLPMSTEIQRHAFVDSKFAEIDGMQVHYRITGKGEPILLLHDANSSLHTWVYWTEVLAKEYQVISVDLPGFGLTSAHPRGSYSTFMYTGFLEKFADTIGLKSFHLAGNGLGAQVAWFFAAEHPERLRKLILLNAPGFEKKSPHWITFVARTPIVNRILHKITPLSFIRVGLEDIYADDHLVTDSLVNLHFELFLRPGARKAYTDRAQVTENNPPVEFIEKITAPTLILWGAEDTFISPENAYAFHKKIRGADLKIYENTGHWPQEESPVQSANDVKLFLEGKF